MLLYKYCWSTYGLFYTSAFFLFLFLAIFSWQKNSTQGPKACKWTMSEDFFSPLVIQISFHCTAVSLLQISMSHMWTVGLNLSMRLCWCTVSRGVNFSSMWQPTLIHLALVLSHLDIAVKSILPTIPLWLLVAGISLFSDVCGRRCRNMLVLLLRNRVSQCSIFLHGIFLRKYNRRPHTVGCNFNYLVFSIL